MKKLSLIFTVTLMAVLLGCKATPGDQFSLKDKVDEFAPFKLTTDLSTLTEKEREMIPVLMEIADIMNELFWIQAYGNRSDFDNLTDKYAKEFAYINYGPWDRLDNLNPFIEGYGAKPEGANFYPVDMTKEEFEALEDPQKSSLYTIIQRDSEGKLVVVPYREAYKEHLTKAIELMNKAIELAEDAGLKKYLTERVKAFQTDEYFESDMAWMDMKDSRIDFVVGPIENYEDRMFGYKAAYEAFILVKDVEWSNNLARFIKMLPALQKELPCDPKYKQEVPGTESDLNVYDAIYYAGDCNAGSKTIAINLPNDTEVQLLKGARRLQLKNSMRAKFDKIMVPISKVVVAEEFIDNVKFDAFFWNVTFHEVAHGLGIKNTITGKGNLREALKEQYSPWEEAKADILGLFMVQSLIEKGEITNITVEDAYTTFISGILRSVRFGASSAHGQANMMCYNFFEEKNAFTRNEEGKYVMNFDNARKALEEWASLILRVEGDGDYDFAKEYKEKNSIIRENLRADLDKIAGAGIPRDIRFEL